MSPSKLPAFEALGPPRPRGAAGGKINIKRGLFHLRWAGRYYRLFTSERWVASGGLACSRWVGVRIIRVLSTSQLALLPACWAARTPSREAAAMPGAEIQAVEEARKKREAARAALQQAVRKCALKPSVVFREIVSFIKGSSAALGSRSRSVVLKPVPTTCVVLRLKQIVVRLWPAMKRWPRIAHGSDAPPLLRPPCQPAVETAARS